MGPIGNSLLTLDIQWGKLPELEKQLVCHDLERENSDPICQKRESTH